MIIPQNDMCEMITGLHIQKKYLWSGLIGVLLLLKPSSMVISLITDKWKDELRQGLERAGLWIGYLERLLIFSFFMIHWYEGIGFLLAAKSIFRFGELRGSDLKTTEYVLIGTFASFLSAVVISLVCIPV